MRELCVLPPLVADEEIVAVTASFDGQLAAVAVRRGDVSSAALFLFDGNDWQRTAMRPYGVAYPHLALLPGNETLVIYSRSDRRGNGEWDDNAYVYDPTGRQRRSFCLGDGIEHVAVDAAGAIWVAYFDEGVFGDGNSGIGRSGLVRFSADGQQLWQYEPPSGADYIADCYALNVDARTTWICYYTEFPLVKIEGGRATAYAPTPVRGARSVMVHGRDVVFVGEYDDHMRLASCRLAGTSVEYVDQAVFVEPGGEQVPLFRPFAARGSRLYVTTDDRVLLADLADDDNRVRVR
ncbi:hypothetical protein [Luedemannella flava]